MKPERFIQVLKARTARMEEVLGKKAAEYARDGDRLSNFKRAAAMLGVTPEKALVGMLSKHWVSVLDMVDDLDRGITYSGEQWDEKLGDSINYHVLLEALITERREARGMFSFMFKKGEPVEIRMEDGE